MLAVVEDAILTASLFVVQSLNVYPALAFATIAIPLSPFITT